MRIKRLYESLSDYDKDEFVEYLIEDGYPRPYSHPAEFKYQTEILKLYHKWNMLTQEEEETILKIANKF